MRSVAALVAVLVGCGRSAFDELRLIAEGGASTVEVTAPGRFKLVFERAFDWQAVGWYDLASDPGRDLAGSDDPEVSQQLLQGLLVLWNGSWLTASTGVDPTIAIEQLDSDRVRLDTAWQWVTPTRVLSASITHVIDHEGTWTLDAKISDPADSSTPIEGVEYADAHVAEALAWDITATGASYEFVALGIDPAPALRVTRTSSVGTLRSDEANNRYWTVGSLPLSLELSWTVSIWRP